MDVTDPTDRRLRARLGGLANARANPEQNIRQLRHGLEQRFIRLATEQCPPGAPPSEIERVAALLRREHFVRLSAAGLKARRER